MSAKILVTGAGGGIGSAIVKRLAEEGNLVIAQYRNRKVVPAENTVPIYGDFSDAKGVEKFFDDAKAFGAIDGLVNCAGISLEKVFSDCTDEEVEKLVFQDLVGVMLLTKKYVPYFVSNGKGSIVNVSSIWGRYGASCEVAYSAAKGGIIAFTKALAKELGPSNVRVNCVAPGLIDTDMNANLTREDKDKFSEDVALCREGKASEVAEAVAFLLSDKASYITGETIGVDGGY